MWISLVRGLWKASGVLVMALGWIYAPSDLWGLLKDHGEWVVIALGFLITVAANWDVKRLWATRDPVALARRKADDIISAGQRLAAADPISEIGALQWWERARTYVAHVVRPPGTNDIAMELSDMRYESSLIWIDLPDHERISRGGLLKGVKNLARIREAITPLNISDYYEKSHDDL